MSFSYKIVDDPILKKVTDQQNRDQYTFVTPISPKTPLGPNWNYQPCVLSPLYESLADPVKNFVVKSDDVWLMSYPKSGTTWCQEMIWLICNNLNYERATTVQLNTRFPFLEIEGIRQLPPNMSPFNEANTMSSPRFIKTHLPVGLLPDQIWTVAPKIVYVRRNPKDVAVSYFHHTAFLHDYTGNMEDFVESYIADMAYYSPYHSHILEYWEVANKCDNILMLKFEDMKRNLAESVRKTAAFFGKSFSDEQVQKLCEHLSFKSMRNNESVNFEARVKQLLELSNRSVDDDENYHFIRKGEVGSWRNELSPRLANKIDAWTTTKVPNEEKQKLFSE